MDKSISCLIQLLNKIISNVNSGMHDPEWLQHNTIQSEDIFIAQIALALIVSGKKLFLVIMARNPHEIQTKRQRTEAILSELIQFINSSIMLCQKPTATFQRLLDGCQARLQTCNDAERLIYQKAINTLFVSPFKQDIAHMQIFNDAYEVLCSIPIESPLSEHRKLLLYVEAIHGDPLITKIKSPQLI